MRTSIKTLEYLVERINTETGSPLKPWERVNDRNVAQIGNFHLSQAYGGVCVHRMSNESGGVTTPIVHGHIPKAELESKLRAFLAGLEFKKD